MKIKKHLKKIIPRKVFAKNDDIFLSLTTELILKKKLSFSAFAAWVQVDPLGISWFQRSFTVFLVSKKGSFWFWTYELCDDFYLLRLGLEMLEVNHIKCFKWLKDYLKDRKLIAEFSDGWKWWR